MADLGSISLDFPTALSQSVSHPAIFRDIDVPIIKIPTNGVITGVVRRAGVVQGGVMLRLYARDSGTLLQQIKTGTNGVYSFTGLDVTYTEYQVMALDPNSTSPFWYTLVHDRITAIPE